jgi:hypothetical protein
MKCPKCGFQQPDSRIDCEFCGLVFAKWKAKQESAQKAAETKPPETPAPSEPSAQPDRELINQPIPDKEEGLSGPFPNSQRIFELLGSLYLQRNSGGLWLYFPWGLLGRGYAVEDSEVLGRIQRLETLFSLFQCSFVSSLGLAACSAYFYNLGGGNPWLWFLFLFLALAYGFFAYQSGRLTADLPLTRGRFNDKQYLRRLFSCFTPASLLSLEAVSLLVALAGIWAASSNKLFLMVGDSAGFLGWLWIGVSLAGFALASFLFYFQKPGRP